MIYAPSPTPFTESDIVRAFWRIADATGFGMEFYREHLSASKFYDPSIPEPPPGEVAWAGYERELYVYFPPGAARRFEDKVRRYEENVVMSDGWEQRAKRRERRWR